MAGVWGPLMARPAMPGPGRIANGLRRRPVGRRAASAPSGACGCVLWAYGLRRAVSTHPTGAQVARAWRRSMAWRAMPGAGRIADGVRRRPAARRAKTASSGASGRILWAYGLRRAGSQWPTRARVAPARGRSMVRFATVGSSRIADGVTGAAAGRPDALDGGRVTGPGRGANQAHASPGAAPGIATGSRARWQARSRAGPRSARPGAVPGAAARRGRLMPDALRAELVMPRTRHARGPAGSAQRRRAARRRSSIDRPG